MQVAPSIKALNYGISCQSLNKKWTIFKILKHVLRRRTQHLFEITMYDSLFPSLYNKTV